MPNDLDTPVDSESGEKQLCVKCMFPNDPLAHFCGKCGAPLSPYAATGPFESVFAEAHVYRQASESPRNVIVLLGVWLMFGTLALAGLTLLVISRSMGIIPGAMGAFFLMISLDMLWKTTRNYMRKGKTNERKEG